MALKKLVGGLHKSLSKDMGFKPISSQYIMPITLEYMETINIVIEKTSDFYSGYTDNVDGIYCAGDSIEAVMADAKSAIALIKENLPEERWPEAIKGEYNLTYRLDPVSFLRYYSRFFSLAGLGRMTGINPKQLSTYLNGRAEPRRKQIDRINDGIHRFAAELCTVSL